MHCVVVIRRGGGRWKNGIVGIEHARYTPNNSNSPTKWGINWLPMLLLLLLHLKMRMKACPLYVDCAGSSPGMRWAIFTSKRNAKHRAVRKTFKWTQSASESEGMRCDGESIDWSSFVVPYWTLSVAEVLCAIKKWQRVTSFDGKIHYKYYPVNFTRRLHDQVSALIKSSSEFFP